MLNYTRLTTYLLLAVLPFSKASMIEPEQIITTVPPKGFFSVVKDHDNGRILLDLPKSSQPFILQLSLAKGIGSNDIGLDRGRLGDTKLVYFNRLGKKVLLTQLNTEYRANSDDQAEIKAVTEAFANSVIWGFQVESETEDSYRIDYTDYLLSDSYGIGSILESAEQGKYSVDPSRSAALLTQLGNFPDNTELEAIITLTGKTQSNELEQVTPDSSAVTIQVHHSLIRLPDNRYQSRLFHPRSGYFPVSYIDYAAPLAEPLTKRFISTHRLSPGLPLIYYLDPGVPEPIRSALMQGATWWDEAFKAAGHEAGFKIKLLPAGADPMDIRYNIIQWVHRRTRGWSYGMSVRDPRTGEILKGQVTLGSLRIRQDMLIAEGLLSPYTPSKPEQVAREPIQKMALARIRQLAAHEIGHTLGLAHNYSASTQGRSSVMDYPHPLLKIQTGTISLTDAYAVGIGSWDKQAILYGYGHLQGIDPKLYLSQHLISSKAQKLSFITDRDARAMGGAHSDAHLWDSGNDIVAELDNTLAVRQIALNNLGDNSISASTPFSELENVLVPIYFLHRYQAEAVTKLIGGAHYQYSTKGDDPNPYLITVGSERQSAALAALYRSISVEALTLPAGLAERIPPKAYGYNRNRESPPSQSLPLFDPLALAEAAVDTTLTLLLLPERLARIARQSTSNPELPDLRELLQGLIDNSISRLPLKGQPELVRQRLAVIVLEHLLTLAYDKQQTPEVVAQSRAFLKSLDRRLSRKRTAHSSYLSEMIKMASTQGDFHRQRKLAELPPGSPI